MTSNHGILFEHVRFSFGERQGVRVLDDLSLEVAKGDFYVLVGPNACGKTTILNLAAGLLAPKSGCGQIVVAGQPANVARIGYAFQNYRDTLFPWKSVLENLVLDLGIQGVPPEQSVRDAEEILGKLGLTQYADKRPYELSGGTQQLVSLACALLNTPPVLLLDEPLSSLDYQIKRRTMDFLLDYWRQYGTTVLMASHNVEDAVILGTRITVLSPRPATVERVFVSSLEKERTTDVQFTDEFLDIRSQVVKALAEAKQNGVLPITK